MALDFTTSLIKLNNQYTIVGSTEGVDPTTKPKKGELYFMEVKDGERTCKIGDGETELQHLPTIGVSSLNISSTTENAKINLAYSNNYELNVGGKSIIFKMPDAVDINKFTDTYQKAKYSSGIQISTGQNGIDSLYVPTGTSATTVALGNHTHNYVPKNAAITAATKCKITYNANGLVTAGADLVASDIPSLAASKITSGTFDVARIPSLAASKITSGTFDVARIPDLSAAKITSGTFNVARIPDLSASKITSGTLPLDRGGTGATTASGARTKLGAADATLIYKDSNNATHVDSSYTSYLNRATGCSICFQQNGETKASFDINNNFVPGTSGTFNIGASDKKWKNIYATAFKGNADSASQLKFIKKLDTADNLDTLTTPGLYWWGNGTSAPTANNTKTLPFTNASVVEVSPIMNPDGTQYGVTQKMWRYGSSGYVAQRTIYGSNVLEWFTFETKDHSHDVSIATSTATNELTLAHGGKYALTAGGQSFVFTMPSSGSTDKKAASGDTNSKIFLIGATSQSSDGQTTYSHDSAYVGTDGCLYSNKTKVSVEGHTHNASNITSGTLSVTRGGTGATSQNELSKKVFTGLYDSAIVSTDLTKGVSLSSVVATQYTTLTTTIKAIVLGATGKPTDSAGVLTFNGVTIANGTDGKCTVSFKVKRRSSSSPITDTTIVLPIISIPLS